MSALPPKADIDRIIADVRFGPIADSCTAANGCFIRSPRRRDRAEKWRDSEAERARRSNSNAVISRMDSYAHKRTSSAAALCLSNQLRNRRFGSDDLGEDDLVDQDRHARRCMPIVCCAVDQLVDALTGIWIVRDLNIRNSRQHDIARADLFKYAVIYLSVRQQHTVQRAGWTQSRAETQIA